MMTAVGSFQHSDLESVLDRILRIQNVTPVPPYMMVSTKIMILTLICGIQSKRSTLQRETNGFRRPSVEAGFGSGCFAQLRVRPKASENLAKC